MSDRTELPHAFVQRMERQLGDQLQAFRDALSDLPPTAIRLHPLKKSAPPARSRPVPWCSAGLYLAERPKFHLDPLWHAGAYYVQDPSSMFLEVLWNSMDLDEEPLVLDACAAPGGKSTHLLSLMAGSGLLIANEIVSKRNKVLVENIIKWGAENQVVLQADGEDLAAACAPIGGFDVVLVDAPCSGEGLFRKDEGARQEWSPEHVASCARRQALLLEDMQELVRPGGYLVYSTCTWSEAENEDQVERLLQNGNWEPVGNAIADFPGIETGRNGLGWRFYPHRLEGEGFYIALLQKKDDAHGDRRTRVRQYGAGDAGFPGISDWADLSGITITREGNHAHLFPSLFSGELEILRNYKKGRLIRYYGIMAGASIHSAFKPFHSLALSNRTGGTLPVLDLDDEGALAYIRKTPPAYRPGYEPGWNVVRYKGINLGWVKVLNNRINNYYPKPWSVRD